jgi:hypothetical protein
LLAGHPGSLQWRIDVQRVGGNAVTDAPLIVVRQIGSYNLEVVVGGMRERALAVAVSKGPGPWDIRAEFIVNDDVSLLVGSPKSSVLGRRPVATSTCEP